MLDLIYFILFHLFILIYCARQLKHNYCSYVSISGTLIKHNTHNLDKYTSLSLYLCKPLFLSLL